jgi:hypothetical protein
MLAINQKRYHSCKMPAMSVTEPSVSRFAIGDRVKVVGPVGNNDLQGVVVFVRVHRRLFSATSHPWYTVEFNDIDQQIYSEADLEPVVDK